VLRQKRRFVTCVYVGLLFVIGNVWAQSKSLEERVDLLEQAFSTSEKTFKVFWKDGVRMQTLDKEIEIRFGGRIQFDMNFTHADEELRTAFADPFDDRFFFRRARIFIWGTLYKYFRFKAEYDFVGGDAPTFTDVYIEMTKIPYVGTITAGKFKGPFGLEELTSSLFITFQERSLTQAFVLGRELGFRFGNAVLNKRMIWAFSITRPTDDDASSADKINFTARLTGLPWYKEKGKRLVHLGVGYIFRNPENDEARLRVRPEARIGDGGSIRFVDTRNPAASGLVPNDDTLQANKTHTFGFEGALVYDSFSLQGEYMFALFNGKDPNAAIESAVDDVNDWAFYIMASYFLTGEHRPYSTSSAAFGRPKPRRNFLQGGWGAWEIAFRFSMIDLSDEQNILSADAAGGKEQNITFGLNWYPNPNSRVIFNYVYGWVDDRVLNGVTLDNDNFGTFMMRFQVDF
jgi:phosphate-selective porin OprO/OprP